jgi:crotonobetainyl-CoA:carnitine CoA-transferase CaiB-like acyl-CoA transferase
MSYFAAGYIADGSVAGRGGSRHSSMAPYEDFATRDGVIYLAAPNQALFITLCKVLGMAEVVDDPLFVNNSSRLANRDALHALIEARLKTDDRAVWEARLFKAGIPCARLQTIDEVVNDPQVEALGLIRNFNHPDIPDYRLVDHPVSYNGTRSFRADPAPGLGQHTETILRSIGFNENEYPALFDNKLGEA